ncbi:zinc finger MYM-type protein 1-like [Impatiens glandulifera]|uniref:zinc finger MYM-type protein 1-like n=1 Tax=Impatiens glandulifera TaxID=253017 RepID=UPI001FB12BB4|nr:zinc finger MYM-type protein 1-like [Impatiens glandulifera]
MEVAYRTQLTTALDVTFFILKQGLPFCGHDESLKSLNKGNFLVLIEWYTQRNVEVSKTMIDNAPGNNQMKSPIIQKDLARACANEVTNIILNDIGGNVFSLMVDECRDNSVKKQMGVVKRYMNKFGCVIDRFLVVVHVSDTSTISLKKAIDGLFAKHKLSLLRLRVQGYDGTSNMRVAKSNRIVSDFFQYITLIVNIVGSSCKRKDKFRQVEHDRLLEGLKKGDIILYLTELYPEDFSLTDRIVLENQLQTYIQNEQNEFSMIQDLESLAMKMVKTGKHIVFTLVYRFIELALVLPVTTASVEGSFMR